MIPAVDPIESILAAAVEIDSAAKRRQYVDEACAGDAELKRRVEVMVGNYFRAGSFLETPARDFGTTSDQTIAERPGTVIGPYKLLEEIGEGGFGVVFMAEQSQPIRRKVALKVLKPGMDTRQVVARFEAERQAIALMDHPNIAKVFDGGATPSGRPYIVMELVKGIAITDYCDQNQLAPRQRLELFIPVCQAVQHAHQKGIIHRDLKPSNVLITVHDTTPVVKVIDFGVAKALGQELTDKTLFTAFAQMIGTPLYMSPEQAGQSGLDVDTRSDIYSLGVLLYELVTGTTPFSKDRFRQAGFDEIRQIIREEEPPRPSTRLSETTKSLPSNSARRHSEPARLSRMVRGELDWIVMKCLEKDRNRRYETAAALVADVRRFLSDEPVQACPPSTWYRFRKLARRNRRALVTATVLTLAALVGTGALAASTVLVWRANKDLTGSLDRERDSVERERREAYIQRITVAHHELLTDVAAALKALRECPEDLRGWEWHYLMRRCLVEPLVIRDKTEVIGVAFSPDGERLASAGGDGAVKIWNSRTGTLTREFPAHDKGACSVVFLPERNHLASAGADGRVKVWDLTTDPPSKVFDGPCDALRKFGAAYTVAFSPPGGRYLAAGSKGSVRIWDWKKNRPDAPEHAISGHRNHSVPVAFSHDGRLLATGGAWEGQQIWDMESARMFRTLPAHQHPMSALAFSPDAGQLATASLDRKVNVWNTTTGELVHTLSHTGNVLGVAFSSDGGRVVSTGEDKTVRVWDAATGRQVLGLRGHTESSGCVAFSPDGQRLASASLDGTIRIWDATPLRDNEGSETNFADYGDEVRSVVVSPNGEKIAAAGHGGIVHVCNARNGQKVLDIAGHALLVWSVAWNMDGERIATAGSDGTQLAVRVFDSRNGQEHFVIQGEGDSFAVPFTVAAFGPNPDGQYLVTGKQNGAVQVWDAKTGEPVRTLGTHDREIRGVVFSPDGKHLASASGDGRVKLWDATRLTAKQEARLPAIQARVPGPCLNIAFSPDSRRLATGGTRNTVKIWDVQTGKELLTIRGHNGDVYTVAFSPNDNGRWIASAGEDSTVKIWDSRTGEEVLTFRGHTGVVTSLAFSPDGKRLYSGSRDKTVKVWELTQLNKMPNR